MMTCMRRPKTLQTYSGDELCVCTLRRGHTKICIERYLFFTWNFSFIIHYVSSKRYCKKNGWGTIHLVLKKKKQ